MRRVDPLDETAVPTERVQRTTPVEDMKIRDVITALKAQGWEEQTIHRGDYEYITLKDVKGTGRVVTLVGDKNDPIAPAALNLIFRRAG